MHDLHGLASRLWDDLARQWIDWFKLAIVACHKVAGGLAAPEYELVAGEIAGGSVGYGFVARVPCEQGPEFRQECPDTGTVAGV